MGKGIKMKTGRITAFVLAISLSMIGGISSQPLRAEAASGSSNVSVSYQAHVQNIGWQEPVKDGALSGTTGRALQLEAIRINVTGSDDLSVVYSTHVQQIGWKGIVVDGETAGTEGRSYRLEAISIELRGEDFSKYDIHYRVHCQDYGWMGWASNGSYAGTSGQAKRLEAIEIKIVSKGASAPGDTYRPFVSPGSSLKYQAYVQNNGWTVPVKEGDTAGSIGQGLYLESLGIIYTDASAPGMITYEMKFWGSDYWSRYASFESSGNKGGDGLGPGSGGRLEVVRIKTEDTRYDIYYRVHAAQIGWLGWAKNGESAGAYGSDLGIEALEIVMVEKGKAAPGNTERSYIGIESPVND